MIFSINLVGKLEQQIFRQTLCAGIFFVFFLLGKQCFVKTTLKSFGTLAFGAMSLDPHPYIRSCFPSVSTIVICPTLAGYCQFSQIDDLQQKN